MAKHILFHLKIVLMNEYDEMGMEEENFQNSYYITNIIC